MQAGGSHCPRMLGPLQVRVLNLRSQRLSNLRPSGASWAWPGEREKVMAVASIRGNHMNLGGPQPPRDLPMDCGPFFFNAPVPSGCTLTMVLSIETASSLMRTICSRCRYSNTLSSTPFFDHRFIRVYTVCQLPNRLGKPRHLHPCSATYSMAFSTCSWTASRCHAEQGRLELCVRTELL